MYISPINNQNSKSQTVFKSYQIKNYENFRQLLINSPMSIDEFMSKLDKMASAVDIRLYADNKALNILVGHLDSQKEKFLLPYYRKAIYGYKEKRNLAKTIIQNISYIKYTMMKDKDI